MATRYQYVLLAVAAVLLISALVHQHDQVIDNFKKPWQNKEDEDSKPLARPTAPRPSFKEIATKYGTDKVKDHHYWFMYEKYFEPLRDKKIKMLEIGLGCDMGYGPGKSYYTWLEYFPNVDLYYMEYDAACAEKWKGKASGATIFAGDQGDRAFLRRFAEESKGDFDIIVDDGGHHMSQQRTSLEELWAIVKPGALYIIEDLQTSYIPGWGGDPTTTNPEVPTMMKFLYQLIDDKMVDGTKFAISQDIRGIDCMKEFLRRLVTTGELAQYNATEISPGGKYDTDEKLGVWVSQVGVPTVYHSVGTAAKMPRGWGGVVDEELRVYGVEGLRVVDGNIMPTTVAATTSMRVYAIAEKAADLIKGRW